MMGLLFTCSAQPRIHLHRCTHTHTHTHEHAFEFFERYIMLACSENYSVLLKWK